MFTSGYEKGNRRHVGIILLQRSVTMHDEKPENVEKTTVRQPT